MALTIQQQFKAQQYIQSWANQEFDWGTADCNQFFIGFHDAVYGTRDLPRVQNQYASRSSARQFLKNLGLTSRQWLTMRGYKPLESLEFENGDVVIHDHKFFSTVFVYWQGVFVSCLEEVNFAGYTPEAVTSRSYTAWRK